jgi:hypothetical protein
LWQIIKEFTEATPLQKLSATADVFSILGLSIATLAAAPILERLTGGEFSLSRFLLAIGFYMIYALVLWSLGTFFWPLILKSWREHKWGAFAYRVVATFICIWVSITIFGAARSALGWIFNIPWFTLPDGEAVVANLESHTLPSRYENDKLYDLEGTVKFSKNVNSEAYSLVVYLRLHGEEIFHLHTAGLGYTNERRFGILKTGIFRIPHLPAVPSDGRNEIYLVLLRDTDHDVDGFFSTEAGLPSRLTYFPHPSITRYKPFIYKLSMREATVPSTEQPAPSEGAGRGTR